ncbi:hypothetical protein [Dyadobacter sp. 3J3]|uniref:hypothetical protein n=1 Tax=Dyadobacter sp. 3J3 TaxID=2606600 RepID=UPI00135B3FFC|nr:hypothetical protein [Dyadobacter sp. 3J3]
MKIEKSYFTATAFSAFMLLTGLTTQAQTLAKNTAWLEKQLNKLVTDDDNHKMQSKDKKAVPKFDFKGCQMNMVLDSKDENVSFGMNMAWQLKDVRKVSYKQNKDGQYTLILDVPADKIKMNMGIGGFSGSFNMDDEDIKESGTNSSFSLDTKDEALVKEIKQKLEESVQLCRKTNS